MKYASEDDYLDLLDRLVTLDDRDCVMDADNKCSAHGWPGYGGEPCPYSVAERILKKYEKDWIAKILPEIISSRREGRHDADH